MTPTALAGRIAAAERGDRELSNAVLRALGWRKVGSEALADDWVGPRSGGWHKDGHQPHPTCSETDIIAMVRAAGLAFKLNYWPNPDGADAHVYLPGRFFEARRWTAATPALALSAALVLAVAKEGDG